MRESLVFGDIEIRFGERQLLVDGERVKLGARAFDVLLALVERRDRIVPKNELLDTVWPSVVVEENNLQVHISSLRKLLGPQAIATIPGRGYRFIAPSEGTPSSAPEPAGPASTALLRHGNVPEVVPTLYGRDDDLTALQALIHAHRLVTLVGTGGVGKSRLALATAYAERERWADGVWLIEFASLADPALVLSAVAQTLGVALTGRKNASDELADALRGRTLLLVLDNCEHLLQAAGRLATTLLERAPSVKLLATSQEPLHTAEEQQFRVQPLAVPSEGVTADARDFGALAMFEARALAAEPRFRIDEKNLAAVIEICRRVDGLPLAIELAAARVPLLGVGGVRDLLDDRFRVLTAGARFGLRRHQTLRATIEWSYSLLSADEQAVLRRLGVFTGSFGLDSAQQVAADGHIDKWAVLDHLGALVDKSFVVAQPGHEPRYRLLETGRAWAIEKLGEGGQTEETLRRHAQAVLVVFERSYEFQWALPTQVLLKRYLPDLDNLRAAMDWAGGASGDAELQIALAGAAAWVWLPAGLRLEGLRRFAQAMARIDGATLPALEARLQLGYTMLAFPLSKAAEVNACERAIELYRQISDRRGLFLALTLQGRRLTKMGNVDRAEHPIREAGQLVDDSWPPALRRRFSQARAFIFAVSRRWEEAREVFEEMLRLDQASGDPVLVAQSLANLVDIALAKGDAEKAVRRGRELVALARRERISLGQETGYGLAMLSAALTQQGQLDEALQAAREASTSLRQAGLQVYCLDHFSLLAFKLGRPIDAARALGRAEAHSVERGDVRTPDEQWARDELLRLLQQALSTGELDRLMRDGATLSDEDAARIALGE